ncbi:hypothetical protein ACFWJ5_21330 [Streptomyces qaidamensis]|uniref:hypothetical protein n=1 Tax=Streptomyces qaidamensis TaxID=1783515 RepID=UPI003664FFFF
MNATPLPGWRVERSPGKTLGRTHAGRFFIPLTISHGEETAEANLVLTGDDTEQLHSELGRLLGGVTPEPLAPVGETA